MKHLLRLLRREGLQLAILALPFVLAAVLWDKLPARIVTHWNLHNRPDGWMPKAQGLLLPPAINVLATTLLAFVPSVVVPILRRDGTAAAFSVTLRRIWRLMRLILSAFIAAICMVAAVAATGGLVDVSWLCSMGGFILLAVCGNFLANLEPNYLLGIRTPWTLGDPATWRSTHRLGSRVIVFGALALLLVGPFVSGTILTVLLLGLIALITVGSLGYSAWCYRKHVAR